MEWGVSAPSAAWRQVHSSSDALMPPYSIKRSNVHWTLLNYTFVCACYHPYRHNHPQVLIHQIPLVMMSGVLLYYPECNGFACCFSWPFTVHTWVCAMSYLATRVKDSIWTERGDAKWRLRPWRCKRFLKESYERKASQDRFDFSKD